MTAPTADDSLDPARSHAAAVPGGGADARGAASVTHSYPNARVLIFCKAPEAGHVKTRLIPAVGERGALAVYEQLAGRVIERALGSRLAPVQTWIAGSTEHPFFAGRQPACCYAQHGPDLGARMFAALRAALAQPGVDRAVLVGSDVPGIDAGYLDRALKSLEDHDAVVGPTEDGGYVLIGLRKAEARLFDSIPWSTPGVLDATRARWAECGLHWEELDALWDVDEPADLRRFEALERALLG